MESNPQARKFVLDPSRDYPNALGFSREEIEEAYQIRAALARAREQKARPTPPSAGPADSLATRHSPLPP